MKTASGHSALVTHEEVHDWSVGREVFWHEDASPDASPNVSADASPNLSPAASPNISPDAVPYTLPGGYADNRKHQRSRIVSVSHCWESMEHPDPNTLPVCFDFLTVFLEPLIHNGRFPQIYPNLSFCGKCLQRLR